MALGLQASMLTSVDISAAQYIDIKTVIYLRFAENLSSFYSFIVLSFRL